MHQKTFPGGVQAASGTGTATSGASGVGLQFTCFQSPMEKFRNASAGFFSLHENIVSYRTFVCQ